MHYRSCTHGNYMMILLISHVHKTCIYPDNNSVRNNSMGNLHSRPKVKLGKKNEIFHYSEKEDLYISRISKFGGEMLYNTENICI